MSRRHTAVALAKSWLRHAAQGRCSDSVALRHARRHLRSAARTPSLMAELLEGDVSE